VPRRLAATLLLAPLLCASACSTATGGFPDGRVIDLSHAFDADTIFWPTEEGFVLERGAEGVTEAGYYYAAHRFRQAEHGGTHIDAPIHFFAGRHTVDEIPLERLMGPAVRVDVSGPCATDRDHRVGVAELRAFEAQHGRIEAGAIVLLRTGFGRHWPDRVHYLGTDERGADAVAKLHFPGLHPDAARWLVAERGIAAVGLDTASIDYGQSKRFETHRILFERNVPAFENLANLDALPARGFTVIALPMKIRGGSGAPLRAVAIVPDDR
jgi:kynurenine formamidase